MIVDVFGCFRSSSTGGKSYQADTTPNQRLSTTLTQASAAINVGVAGGAGAVALTVANVTSNNAIGHLYAWPRGLSVPATSNINLMAGDHISNLMVTPTRRYSGADYFSIDRNSNTTGSTTVQIVQLGYFS